MPALDFSPRRLPRADIELLVIAGRTRADQGARAWPRTVAAAAVAHEPHRIAFYVHELAAAFHGFWAKGKDDRVTIC